MNPKDTEKAKAQHTFQTAAESVFSTLRAQGIDLPAIEEDLDHCICGQPQVIVFARQNYRTGLIKFYTMCTEPSRQVCRVSKRLRIHREEFPELATDQGEADEATAEVEAIHKATAREVLDNLDAILDEVEANEAAADKTAEVEAQAIVKAMA